MAEQSEELKAKIASIREGDEVDLTLRGVRVQGAIEEIKWDNSIVIGDNTIWMNPWDITAVHSIKHPEMPEPDVYERAIDRVGDVWIRNRFGRWVFVNGDDLRMEWFCVTEQYGPMRPFSRELVGVPLEQGV